MGLLTQWVQLEMDPDAVWGYFCVSPPKTTF